MKQAEITHASELKTRLGRKLRNRVVVPPMASETASPEGIATETTIGHYRSLAESGAGLVMVEYTYVHPTGRSEPHQLGIDRDESVEGLARIASVIHESGALSLIQLTHSGGKSSRDMTGGVLMGPSGIAVPVKDREMEKPDAMSEADLELWIESFLSAAGRASRAGFDGVELHSAHGYGLNQWLSPLTNQRADSYGGTLRNRARLLLELVSRIRALHPELLVSVRIPGQDFLDGGLTTEDMKQVSAWLEDAGVDILNVSSGIGGWRRPRDRIGEGYLVGEASEIQAHVSVPVMGVGGIETRGYIDQALAAGHFALAAVGRAILKNPREWGERELCTA